MGEVRVRVARAEELDAIAKIIREEIYPEISFEEMREYQKRGYGSYLWKKSREIINEFWRSKGCTEVLIFTETEEENSRTCNFYRKILETA